MKYYNYNNPTPRLCVFTVAYSAHLFEPFATCTYSVMWHIPHLSLFLKFRLAIKSGASVSSFNLILIRLHGTRLQQARLCFRTYVWNHVVVYICSWLNLLRLANRLDGELTGQVLHPDGTVLIGPCSTWCLASPRTQTFS